MEKGEILMDEQNDTIEKLLFDLPQYTVADYVDYIPYERAARVCRTKEEIEAVLEKIYEGCVCSSGLEKAFTTYHERSKSERRQ